MCNITAPGTKLLVWKKSTKHRFIFTKKITKQKVSSLQRKVLKHVFASIILQYLAYFSQYANLQYGPCWYLNGTFAFSNNQFFDIYSKSNNVFKGRKKLFLINCVYWHDEDCHFFVPSFSYFDKLWQPWNFNLLEM